VNPEQSHSPSTGANKLRQFGVRRGSLSAQRVALTKFQFFLGGPRIAALGFSVVVNVWEIFAVLGEYEACTSVCWCWCWCCDFLFFECAASALSRQRQPHVRAQRL
jgi:hypothetical protein